MVVSIRLIMIIEIPLSEDYVFSKENLLEIKGLNFHKNDLCLLLIIDNIRVTMLLERNIQKKQMLLKNFIEKTRHISMVMRAIN